MALRHYERALAVTPHSAEAMYNTAVALAEDGATDRSIFMYAITMPTIFPLEYGTVFLLNTLCDK